MLFLLLLFSPPRGLSAQLSFQCRLSLCAQSQSSPGLPLPRSATVRMHPFLAQRRFPAREPLLQRRATRTSAPHARVEWHMARGTALVSSRHRAPQAAALGNEGNAAIRERTVESEGSLTVHFTAWGRPPILQATPPEELLSLITAQEEVSPCLLSLLPVSGSGRMSHSQERRP